jgi:hypothetical protein
MSEEAAWARLEEAIETFLTEGGQPGLLLDWVLVTHKISPNDDGTNNASTGYTGSEHQTHYRTLGLLEYAKTVVQAEIEDSLKGMD